MEYDSFISIFKGLKRRGAGAGKAVIREERAGSDAADLPAAGRTAADRSIEHDTGAGLAQGTLWKTMAMNEAAK